MPKLTIDGIEVEVPAGITVLQACELAGVEIPRFCYHERLSIAGNCRMCLVEVEEGPPKPIASCAMPVAEGMVVNTDTPMVQQGAQRRDGIPADQPSARLPDLRPGRRVRPAGPGDGLRHGPLAATPRTSARCRTRISARWSRPSMNRCIHCTRCIRFVTEVAGVAGAGRHRPRRAHGGQAPMSRRRSTSELSGNIIDLCPVGALTSKPYAFIARPWELRKTEVDRRARRGRHQHPHRCPRPRGAARAAAPQRGRERGVDRPTRRASPSTG